MPRRILFLTLLTFALASPAHAAITVSDATVTEGGKLAFSVDSDQPALGVEVTTSDGSAKAASDYEAKSQTLNFVALDGGDPQIVEVQTRVDGDPEPDETLTLTATPPSGDPDSGTGTIKNDDQPTLSIGDVTIAENGGTAKLTVTSQVISSAVTVDYATADGSAGSGDYESRSGTLTLAAGQGAATIDVPIRNDDVDEDDESLKVTLSNVKDAKVGDGEATISITNDDVRTITVGDIGVVEGDGEQTVARLPVQLNQPTFRTVSLAFVTIDGPAKAPRDYLARFGSVVFQPGQTTQFIDIAIASDDVREPDEFFAVLIGQAQGARIARDAAVAAIRDDDADNKSADSQAPRMKLTKPRLSGSRSIRARVTCPRGEQRCKGRLVLYAKVGRAERRVGSKTFSLPGNAARTLRITIPRSFLSRGRRTGRLAIRAYMVTSDAAENVDTKTASATLRFKRS